MTEQCPLCDEQLPDTSMQGCHSGYLYGHLFYQHFAHISGIDCPCCGKHYAIKAWREHFDENKQQILAAFRMWKIALGDDYGKLPWHALCLLV